MTLGDAIARARDARAWTQAQLAAAVGYRDRSAVSHLETGRRTPSPGRIQSIAAALGSAFVATAAGWRWLPEDALDGLGVLPGDEEVQG